MAELDGDIELEQPMAVAEALASSAEARRFSPEAVVEGLLRGR